MLLPRRLLRWFCYFVVVLIIAINLLLIANKHQIIDMNNYIPYDLFKSTAPTFFQPPSDSFIIDVSINSCLLINSKNPNCGLPSPDHGLNGDLSEYEGGWSKLPKDITLNKSYFKKQFFSIKKIKHSSFENLIKFKDIEDKVILDIAVSNPTQDKLIKGNEKLKLPSYIIKTFHEQVVYDDETHKNLIEQNSDNKIDKITKPDETKQASYKINQMEQENEEKQQGKREEVDDRNQLNRLLYVPTMKEVEQDGWVEKFNGIWIKYGSHNDKNSITAIDLLFGPEAVDPRPNWNLIKIPLQGLSNPSDLPVFISFRRGPKIDYRKKYLNNRNLKLSKDYKFKILQVADLHFSTGYGKCLDPNPPVDNCKADSKTLKFIETVLDLEKPDLVILTGDQIYGDTAPDSESAIFKVFGPFIDRKIPFACVLGNHDAEGSIKSKKEIMSLYNDLPYSLGALGPEEIDGWGNYVLPIEDFKNSNIGLSLYFLDSHSYTKNPKAYPGYDWIKDNQIIYLREEYASIEEQVKSFEKKHLSMAFFHIPLPEYRNLGGKEIVGSHKEGITAPRYNSGVRDALQDLGIHVASVGHDHCNDYCLLDKKDSSPDNLNEVWLCYGGGVGNGGYGGYGGYIRRMRIYDIDLNKGEIKTWKRTENEPVKIIDEQVLITDGRAPGE
ncbi:unnamed protein product [Candida verbasci]|uniref:Calcineurin-like phosphoesterase domain-containing protein n=1 Tax=Candida verbasci TaxID=1227364 RepID=A0A9W4TSG6_9ASCO|nr:unnamed protein product [Candida verbasci]